MGYYNAAEKRLLTSTGQRIEECTGHLSLPPIQVKGIFFAKVDCIPCALRIEFTAIYLIDKVNNTEIALNVLKPDITEQIGRKVVKGFFYGNTQRQTQ